MPGATSLRVQRDRMHPLQPANLRLDQTLRRNLAAMVAGHMRLQLVTPPVQFPGIQRLHYLVQRFHRDPASAWLRGALTELSGAVKIATESPTQGSAFTEGWAIVPLRGL